MRGPEPGQGVGPAPRMPRGHRALSLGDGRVPGQWLQVQDAQVRVREQ